jgi:hypothetical protein
MEDPGIRAVPRLLSVNVGLPRDVAWRGRTVHTAVCKTPVQGRRVARRLNIDGDGQGDLAGHGGEHRAVLYTRSTHTGIGKPSSVEAISAMGNSERISPSTGCPMARCDQGWLSRRECRF